MKRRIIRVADIPEAKHIDYTPFVNHELIRLQQHYPGRRVVVMHYANTDRPGRVVAYLNTEGIIRLGEIIREEAAGEVPGLIEDARWTERNKRVVEAKTAGELRGVLDALAGLYPGRHAYVCMGEVFYLSHDGIEALLHELCEITELDEQGDCLCDDDELF